MKEKKQVRAVVADGNRDAAEMLSLALEVEGYRSCAVYNGQQAIEVTKRHRPDLVLLSLMLPDADGREVCRQMREFLPIGEGCIIAVTGWTGDRVPDSARWAGFDEYLMKPVEVQRVLEVFEGCKRSRRGASPDSGGQSSRPA